MRIAQALRFSSMLVMLAAINVGWAPYASAGHDFKVLYSFKGGADGDYPLGTLLLDADGNLYGATSAGGSYTTCSLHGCGTLFELVRGKGGDWMKKTIHVFQDNNDSSDGSEPTGGLISDEQGNLIGTTISGGGGVEQCSSLTGPGCGTVFQLTPQPSGDWTETILYRFQGDNAGGGPEGQLLRDEAGKLYGTTVAGGNCCEGPLIFGWGGGAAFELTLDQGSWGETVLHDFCALSGCRDGNGPQDGLVRGPDGNLYGTAPYGGSDAYPCALGCGVIFRLTQEPDGTWSETRIHTFRGKDGAQPASKIVFDQKGNIYGTTQTIGVFGYGNAFKLSPKAGGGWRFKVLYNFRNGAYQYDGGSLSTAPIVSGEGDLYGTIWGGSFDQCSGVSCGAIYRLSPGGVFGRWVFTVIHKFSGQDGILPSGKLIIDDKGNLYGVAGLGGAAGHGVVFRITP